MRIAQVAPLYESVPPRLYGGTERVVSYLTEALVASGHNVTLFASGDSLTAGRLIPVCKRSLRLDPHCVDRFAHHLLLLETVAQCASEFDVIHYHIDYSHFPLSRRLGIPQLTTLHGRLDIPDLFRVFLEFEEMPVVSISDAQRIPLPDCHWLDTIYHGLPRENFRFHPEPGEYLAFLGRISPEKRVDRAIDIAIASGRKIRIAAKIDEVDRIYYENEIRPKMSHPLVEFIGEIGESDKNEFLGSAKALLFPIDWPEPFGLVMIEAMACGTPVIAFDRGSVREVIEPGVSGFIVNGIEESVNAVSRIDEVDRRECRRSFEERFSSERMARDYVRVYESVIANSRARTSPTGSDQQDIKARRSHLYSRELASRGKARPRFEA